VPKNSQYDVIIAGGSVAGCTLALCYARHNLRVAILEQKPVPTDYKTLCTHFVQPVALPVLRELDLDRALEDAGAVRTKAAFWTPAGWIDPPEAYGNDDSMAYAYNIERSRLDPFLRERIEESDHLDLLMGHRITKLQSLNREWVVEATTGSEHWKGSARLVVAADGRHSLVARLLENESQSHENQRSALFGYFENVPAPAQNRSLFILSEPERGFLYPLCNGRTLLALYLPRSSSEEWQRQRNTFESDVKTYFERFPGVPDLSLAHLVSPVFGYPDYPNLVRKAVSQRAAFIGDAALSLDPLSGVGCGFAILSAHLLAQATSSALREGSEFESGLLAYETEFNRLILPHADGIRADSLVVKSEATSLQTYRCIASNPALQKQFVDLTGRVILPASFQKAFASAMIKAQIAALKSKTDNAKTTIAPAGR